MKNHLLVACTIINVLITLIALIFVFKVDVTWTGTLGDTFGGLISPIIGGVSIYFIYETFKSQRAQLRDQVDTNRVTMGTLHLEKIDTLINGVKRHIDKYSYVTLNYVPQSGFAAISLFNHKFQNLTGQKYKDLDQKDFKLVDDVFQQISQTRFIVQLLINLKKDLTNEYASIAEKNVHDFATLTIPVVLDVYASLLGLVSEVQNEEGEKSDERYWTIYGLVKKTTSFTEELNKLVEAGYLKKGCTISSIYREAWSPNPIPTDHGKLKYDEKDLREIDVRRYYALIPLQDLSNV